MKPINNFPERFGFESDLACCVGKTIAHVEQLRMEWGCTWDHAYAVRFTDGSRAFFAGHAGTGIMNPQIDGDIYGARTVASSEIFTPEEYAVMCEDRKRKHDAKIRDRERREREEYQRLSAKFLAEHI